MLIVLFNNIPRKTLEQKISEETIKSRGLIIQYNNIVVSAIVFTTSLSLNCDSSHRQWKSPFSTIQCSEGRSSFYMQCLDKHYQQQPGVYKNKQTINSLVLFFRLSKCVPSTFHTEERKGCGHFTHKQTYTGQSHSSTFIKNFRCVFSLSLGKETLRLSVCYFVQ